MINVKNNSISEALPEWARDIVATSVFFFLDFHRDVNRLGIDIQVTSLYDSFFQHHNDVVAIT